MRQRIIVKYHSGKEIRKGDRVLYFREPGEIEFIVDQLSADDAMDWYMREFGGGVVIPVPKRFGQVFVETESLPETEEFEFISRADG